MKHAITNITRMWLTRSVKPFIFKGEYDRQLPFGECRNLGLYVHIPFCRSICDFCPYCKVLYTKEVYDNYIDALIQEIHLVGSRCAAKAKQSAGGRDSSDEGSRSADSRDSSDEGSQSAGGQYSPDQGSRSADSRDSSDEGSRSAGGTKKKVTSLYFGGGTPALAAERIGEIVAAIGEHYQITEGIGIELHPDNVTVPVLQTLKQAGVTKISIGIQSFSPKFQKILGRRPVGITAMAKALRAVTFETVSMDFIFALPGQTFQDLRADIDLAFANGANHIAIYPFIDFTFTTSSVHAMPKRKKRQLLDRITSYCASRGYIRTSIWTFSNSRKAQYSSMIRENFLGFGCSATTLLKKQFKINTFSIEEYCRRIGNGLLPTSLTIRFSARQRMVYYLFWAAYSMEISAEAFEKFFGVSLEKMYGPELRLAKWLGFLTKKGGIYRMTPKGAFYYHYYENFYTLAYIDKMWGIMRKEAFPGGIRL